MPIGKAAKLRDPSLSPPQPDKVLSGWKDIARYLALGVRTVQRYERELALPIHRMTRNPRGAVMTTRAELDEWLAAAPTRHEQMHRRIAGSETNRLTADFLRIDSEIGLTFCALALSTDDRENRRRRSETARKAYDTIVRLRHNVELSAAQNDKLDANLHRLKNNLETLGHRF
jgi:hypothetical protein